jgi:hypothetical protein
LDSITNSSHINGRTGFEDRGRNNGQSGDTRFCSWTSYSLSIWIKSSLWMLTRFASRVIRSSLKIVRTDLKSLVDLDLHGAPYGYTPMCDSRAEVEGFRFWKQGFWKDWLKGLPYHIRHRSHLRKLTVVPCTSSISNDSDN